MVDQHDPEPCCLKGNETPPMTMGEKTQKIAATKREKRVATKKDNRRGAGLHLVAIIHRGAVDMDKWTLLGNHCQ